MTKATKLEASLGTLRRVYLAEVERFAEELRPRFLSGELRGFWSGDGDDAVGWEPGRPVPLFVLEALCARRFGRSRRLAFLAASCATAIDFDKECPSSLAGAAVARDVLAIARRQGWHARPPRRPPTPVWTPEEETAEGLAAKLALARSRLAEAYQEATREVPRLGALLAAGTDFPADFLAVMAPAQRAMLDIALQAARVECIAGRLAALGQAAA